MEPVSDSLDKSPINGLRVFWPLQCCIDCPGICNNLIFFFDCKDIWHLSTIQYVVDVFQEYLIDDLIVSKEESDVDILFRRLPHHLLQKCSEALQVVAFCNFDLSDVTVINK